MKTTTLNQADAERLEYRLGYRPAMNDQEGDECPKIPQIAPEAPTPTRMEIRRETRDRTPNARRQIDDGKREIAVEPFDQRPDDV